MLRAWALLAAVLALLFVIADVSVGCYYARKINHEGFAVDNAPEEFTLRVETAGEDRVTLRNVSGDSADLSLPGVWGIVTPTGYGRVGPVTSTGGDTVTREFTTLSGTVTAGQPARLDKYAFPGSPAALGLAFEEVSYESNLGPMSAWHVPGTTPTWVIFVHGRASELAQSLRALGPIAASGAHVLVIRYRNDEGMPPDPSGRYQYGKTEWEDLEGAAHYALNNGAQDIVIVGYSMGGSIALAFMRHSLLAEEVSGLVLDAPVLDFWRTVDYAGERRGLPGFLTWTAKVIAGWRYGIDWAALDYLRDATDLDVPALVIHGGDDEKVPLATSRDFAALPERARLEEFSGARHTAAWNMDPARYDAALSEFLEATAP